MKGKDSQVYSQCKHWYEMHINQKYLAACKVLQESLAWAQPIHGRWNIFGNISSVVLTRFRRWFQTGSTSQKRLIESTYCIMRQLSGGHEVFDSWWWNGFGIVGLLSGYCWAMAICFSEYVSNRVPDLVRIEDSLFRARLRRSKSSWPVVVGGKKVHFQVR